VKWPAFAGLSAAGSLPKNKVGAKNYEVIFLVLPPTFFAPTYVAPDMIGRNLFLYAQI